MFYTRLTMLNAQLLPLWAHATVSFCELFSFSHPSLPFFSIKLDYRYSVWVHTWHFALHVAGWVRPLTHHHHLSCGLHHTLQAHISTCHFQPDAARCVTATLLHCPFMLRVYCCHPHLLHCGVYHCHPLIAQGVSLPSSLVALQGCCCHPSLC